MNSQKQLPHSLAIRGEIQRFESVQPNVYNVYKLLHRIADPSLRGSIQELVTRIEGEQVHLSLRKHAASFQSSLLSFILLVCVLAENAPSYLAKGRLTCKVTLNFLYYQLSP